MKQICFIDTEVSEADNKAYDFGAVDENDDKLHTEQSFKKKLKIALQNFSSRRGWKYMGVWERAPETNRLHFHGLFKIPLFTLNILLLSKHQRILNFCNAHYSQVHNQLQTHQELSFPDILL